MILNNYYKFVGAFAVKGNGYRTASKLRLVNFAGDTSTNTYNVTNTYYLFTTNTSDKQVSMARVSKSWTASQTGIALGSGTTPPTINDYCLENALIDQSISSYSASVTVNESDNSVKNLITVQNTGSSAITIAEVGLWGLDNTTSASISNRFLFERSVLDTPVVIQPGGAGVIEYTISFTPPTQQGA